MKPQNASASLSWRVLESLGFLAVMGLLLAGCTETRYVAVPMVTPASAPYLPACATHAARGERRAMGSDFRMLQLNPQNLAIVTPNGPVGHQNVAYAYDGDGIWLGRPGGTHGEWHRVRFHCLINPQGRVVYSFVRGY